MTTSTLALEGREFDPIILLLWLLAVATMIALTAGVIHQMTMGSASRTPQTNLAHLLTPSIVNDDAQALPDPDAGLSLAERIDRWQPFIAEASHRFAIPQAWIRAVMRAESGGRLALNGQPITSSVGAAGLMQLMKETYDEMRAQQALGSDVYNPHDNILAAAAYLKVLKKRYGFPNMFAAYNAGPARVDQHLKQGTPLPPETRAYLVNVVSFIGVKKIAVAQNISVGKKLAAVPEFAAVQKVTRGRHRAHSRQTMLASNA
ncbi:MAG TPA: lytic transglycosylase domain-containing protein [Rhizomicrobium sp.]|nr:lytic transglycosylase domain-containing protein [Rhizomicrobium sp.]